MNDVISLSLVLYSIFILSTQLFTILLTSCTFIRPRTGVVVLYFSLIKHCMLSYLNYNYAFGLPQVQLKGIPNYRRMSV